MLDEKYRKYLSDTEFLLSKHKITEYLIKELSAVENTLKDEVIKTDFIFPEGTFTKSGKISKGENYKGLPFFILDYPRLFSHVDMFAYRTMIWWGHEISFSLLLQGHSFDQYRDTLIRHFDQLKDCYFCVHDTPWEYYFEKSNYILLSEITQNTYEMLLSKRKFVKLAKKIRLDELESISEKSRAFLSQLLKVLKQDNTQKGR